MCIGVVLDSCVGWLINVVGVICRVAGVACVVLLVLTRPPPYGVIRTKWEQWFAQAINATFMVSVLPLDAAHSAKFDEQAFWSWFKTVRGHRIARTWGRGPLTRNLQPRKRHLLWLVAVSLEFSV